MFRLFKRRQAQPNRNVFLDVAGGREGVLHNASGQEKTSESPVPQHTSLISHEGLKLAES